MSETNKEIVKKINASFAEGKTEGFLSYCSDNVKWTLLGEKPQNGKEAIREWMKSMEGTEPPKFTVDNLIADGDIVVANGDMTMKEKDGTEGSYGYCDIYRFSGDKVAQLTSYVVKTKGEGGTQRSATA